MIVPVITFLTNFLFLFFASDKSEKAAWVNFAISSPLVNAKDHNSKVYYSSW